MGSRDIRHHEAKKPKKKTGKTGFAPIVPTPQPEVEVARQKGKKPRGEQNA